MDATGWAAADHGSSTVTFITLGAAATGFVMGRRSAWITRDAIVIPSCLQSVHDDLEAIRKIFEELDEDEKARIEELRGRSDMTLSQLQRKYKEYLTDYHVQIIQFDDLGWVATWNPFNAAASKAKENAEALATDVKALRKDVVSSTSGRLREDRIRRQREREADIPLLPLPVTAASTLIRAPPQVRLDARSFSQFPAIFQAARQTLAAAT